MKNIRVRKSPISSEIRFIKNSGVLPEHIPTIDPQVNTNSKSTVIVITGELSIVLRGF